MTAQPVISVLGENTSVAGADELALCLQEQASPIVEQARPVFIDIGAGDLSTSANTDVVGAIHTAAA